MILVVLAAVAVLSRFVAIHDLTVNAGWIMLVTYLGLVVGCVYRRRVSAALRSGLKWTPLLRQL